MNDFHACALLAHLEACMLETDWYLFRIRQVLFWTRTMWRWKKNCCPRQLWIANCAEPCPVVNFQHCPTYTYIDTYIILIHALNNFKYSCLTALINTPMHACMHVECTLRTKGPPEKTMFPTVSQTTNPYQVLPQFLLILGKKIDSASLVKATCMHACMAIAKSYSVRLDSNMGGVCFRTNWSHTRTKENVLKSSGHRFSYTVQVACMF